MSNYCSVFGKRETQFQVLGLSDSEQELGWDSHVKRLVKRHPLVLMRNSDASLKTFPN